MITYELMLLLRVMPKPQTKEVLRRVSDHIFQRGGFIRKLDNLGTCATPYKISSHDAVHHQASYFVFEFNAPPLCIDQLLDEYGRDVDVMRKRIFKKNMPKNVECTLHEELLPPPYRKDVQELVAKAKRHEKPKFRYNADLDYYPFQK